MRQYHYHLELIKQLGTTKPAAREGMPGSISLFGHQNRYDLKEGFPILTTKEIKFSNIVAELLWFLRGDTNIKFLIEDGCNIWNQDAYNYYVKIASANDGEEMNAILGRNADGSFSMLGYKEFCDFIKETQYRHLPMYGDYKLGDCGHQYGRVWRKYGEREEQNSSGKVTKWVDQIEGIVQSLTKSPQGRRHIVTAIDPVHDQDLALYWCHCMFQFNARPINVADGQFQGTKYYLDCHLYQRSADMFLGVPYNIASYALLTSIIAELVGMEVGHFIHSFGDSHIYDNHMEQVDEILSRDVLKYPQPKLKFSDNFHMILDNYENEHYSLDDAISELEVSDFTLEGYESYPEIKAKLSTGLK